MSDHEKILNQIKESFLSFDFDGTKELVRKALEEDKIDPIEIIEKSLRPAMEIVGDKFEKGEFFLSELVVAGDLFKEIMDELIKPKLKKAEKELGTIVIGTVRGDLHDIGKNIVATMLEVAGFKVIDLGVDVSPEAFVEAVKKYNPDIVGMSALLTTTMIEMENVIKELEKAGVRDKVKVIVGGAAVTDEFAKKIGADAYGKDAVEAVEICKKLLGLN
ncbi:MAG: cobalamin-binding protein [Thermofilum sp. ex4484_79]|nr:MAG: cobalamin-binding protein [Thermofilum sp. ex4484_79]